ncbi:MBL fold metallo-hydrolase RNA specificity domain-containing protein [Colwellia sp. 20A7]|uniref:MBL fold metallo-hydrolase RNA specificity domain-containing protein n=1 Tax=Colwellia sp. 20A7 TaxID=2689569 RepID=UPI00135689C5|nr:MBL fold metallo-hydrolase [Colwellia sp. 20A7]
MNIQHHGAVNGVTGSCHQLHINNQNSILIDCGLFQGAEKDGGKTSADNNHDTNDEVSNAAQLTIDFDISTVRALIVTHCHIDHVGRIPYLLAAGFRGPIYATKATAQLLPLVIEDALKVGVTRNKSIIDACLKLLKNQLIPVDYKQWQAINITNTKPANEKSASKAAENKAAAIKDATTAKIKFQMAGHILGSAYIEVEIASTQNNTNKSNHHKSTKHRIVFSGDLGAPYAPLLPAPKSPYRADTLIIESTYGDKNHQRRKERTQQLQHIIEKAVADNGVVLIPAFSIGRTQELLYELESIIFQQQRAQHQRAKQQKANQTAVSKNNQQKKQQTDQADQLATMWQNIDIIVDSPMAAKFTEQYRNFKTLWDNEAKRKLNAGRHPLNFEQLYTVNSHQEHLDTIAYLAKGRNFTNAKPAIVIAASGMCSGGRIVNYLKAFLTDSTTDVLFVGYQTQGTLGRSIQQYGPTLAQPNKQGYVYIDGSRITINAMVHTISSYSAHADQNGLINFVKRMHHKPQHIKIVHGDEDAKQALAQKYQQLLPNAKIEIPMG